MLAMTITPGADMTHETILVETKGKVGIIRLNRPQALNALNAKVNEEMTAAIDAFEADATIDGALTDSVWQHAAVLTGFSEFSPQDGIPAADSTQANV